MGPYNPLSQAPAAIVKTQQLVKKGPMYAHRFRNDGGAGENGNGVVKKLEGKFRADGGCIVRAPGVVRAEESAPTFSSRTFDVKRPLFASFVQTNSRV